MNLTGQRRAWGAAAGILLLGFAIGCHHQDKSVPVAATAPPPASSSPANTRPTTPTATSHPPAPIVREPAGEPAPDEVKGKPISTEVGLASWYGPYQNRRAADGSVYDGQGMTAAHRTLPMGTTVRVTNLTTNQSVMVRITDRGPFVPGRMLDLSMAAAKEIGVYKMGIAKVKVEAFAKPGADPEGRWCVQIGAFIDANDAVQMKNDLLTRYKTAKVIEFAGPTGHWVRINPTPADKTTADKIADSIHLPDAEPYVVRTN
jgi:rare lipoprotein A